MGPPPRSLAAEANGCFMVRVRHGPNRIQGCGARDAPDSGLPSDQSKHASTIGEQSDAIKLDTDIPIQGCVKSRRKNANDLTDKNFSRFFYFRSTSDLENKPRRASCENSAEFLHSLAKPSANERYLRIPAEDPRRVWSDSGHLVADPIGHEVRF